VSRVLRPRIHSVGYMGVTRGQLPQSQRAGLLGLNGGGAAATVPPGGVEMSSGDGHWSGMGTV